jgi:hypothetical protein
MILVEGNNPSRWCDSIVAYQESTRKGISFVSERTSLRLKQEKKG